MPESLSQKYKILVVENEPELREIIVFYLESHFNVKVVEAANGEIAKQILESDPDFHVVVSGYNMPLMNGGQLLQYIRASDLPIKFILVSDVNIKELAEFSSVQPDGRAEKLGFSENLNLSIKKFLDMNADLDSKNEYNRISIKQLFNMGNSKCSIFAKLSELKFVKVFHEDDTFESADYDRFKNKNIDCLYIESKNSEGFFNLLNQSYLDRLSSKTITVTEKSAVTIDVTAAIQEMALNFGFSAALEKMTKLGVDIAIKNITSNPSLKSLLDQLKIQNGGYLAVHSSRLPYVANQIATLMGWQSESTALKMAYASMLHDSLITHQAHEKFDSDDTTQGASLSLSNKELQDFMYHPTKAAEMAKKFKGMPPDVDVIISQHHENCDGTGFPNKFNHTKISPLSSAFIVAHDLLCFYEKSGDELKIEEFVKEYESKYTAGFFKKILKELSAHPFK